MSTLGLLLMVSVILFISFISIGGYFGWRLLKIRMKTTEHTINSGLENNEFDQAFLDVEKREIKIEKENGEYLSGWVFPGEGKKTIIFCHGITWTRHGMVKYFDYFEKNGWNMIAYDHQNHGESPGKYPTYGLKEKVDLKRVADWAMSEFPETEVLAVYGESMGGGTVLQYSSMDDRLNFIIADCPYTDYKKLLYHQLKLNHVRGFVQMPVLWIAELVTCLFGGFSTKNIDPMGEVMKTKVPILLCHGAADDYVPTQMSIDMYEKRKDFARTDLVLIDGAKHAEAIIVDPEKYKAKVKEFVESLGY